jgi:hypothetical protein
VAAAWDRGWPDGGEWRRLGADDQALAVHGCDPKSLLQLPNSDGLGDAFIAKMLTDIPLLRQLPRGSVNVYFQQITKDSKRLLIEAGDITIESEEIQS